MILLAFDLETTGLDGFLEQMDGTKATVN